MELQHMTMTNGYVGGMGKTWETPTPESLEQAILGAMRVERKTRAEIVAILEAGLAVKWCQSPNFSYDYSYGIIGRKRTAPPVEMASCDCGHTIPVALRMSTSLGSSCPDCYDRMSD